MKTIRLLPLLLVTLVNLMAFANLEISMLPSKNVSPGEVAIQVLPIKAKVDTTYKLHVESQLQWRTEAQEEIELKAGELTYLTFYTYTPSYVDAGTIHELKIDFEDKETGEVVSHILDFIISKKQDLDFFNADQNIETNKRNYTLNLKVKNSGNASQRYEFEVRNLTPDIDIRATKQSMEIAPNAIALLPVKVLFSNDNDSYAAFEVNAKVNGIIKFQKKFQVKYIHNSTSQDRQGNYLDTTLTITNENLSVGGNNSNLSSVILQTNGALSDYVSLSSYIQANMVDGQGENARGTFHFEGDNWKFSGGNDVSFDVDANIGNESKDGIAYSRNILPNLEVGTLLGVDEDNDLNIAAMAKYDPLPGQRTFVVLNQNTSNGELSGSVGYRGIFVKNDNLTIAPSLTVADDPDRGIIQDYKTALTYMVRKNLPISISTGYRSDKFHKLVYNSASTNFQFKGALIELRRTDEFEVNDNYNDFNGNEYRNSNNIRISFPLGNGFETSVNYQDYNSNRTDESRKFLTFAYQRTGLYAAIKAGVASKDYALDLGEDYTDKPFVSVNLSYSRPQFTLRAKFDYEKYSNNSYRKRAAVGIDYDVNTSYLSGQAYLTAVHEEGQYNDYATQTQTDLDYIEAGFRKDTTDILSLEIYGRVEDNHYQDNLDYIVGVRVQYRFGTKTPKKVEDLFGGKKTGSIKGRICFDENGNGKCEDSEKGIAGLDVYSVTSSARTNKNGEYEISELKADNDHISLTKSQVSAKSFATRDYLKMTRVIKNQSVTVDFPLYQISMIDAFSYVDINQNGQYDKDLDTMANSISYRLVKSTGEIIAANGRDEFKTYFSALRDGEYLLIATATSPYFEDIQIEQSISLPADNQKVIEFAFIAKENGTASDAELVLTELESNIISKHDDKLTLTVDSSETEYNSVRSLTVKLNGKGVNYKIIEEFEGYWYIEIDLSNSKKELKKTNSLNINGVLENTNSRTINIERAIEFYSI